MNTHMYSFHPLHHKCVFFLHSSSCYNPATLLYLKQQHYGNYFQLHCVRYLNVFTRFFAFNHLSAAF